MSKIDLELLKARVLERYDADYLVDVLRISAEELLEAFPEKLMERQNEFDELEDEDE